MPICNTTLEYRGGLADRLLDSPLLRFDEVRERGSKNVKRYYTAMKFRDLTFVVYPSAGKVILKGSWAKFHNNGLHNYTRYTTADLLADIGVLSELFNYDFSSGLLHGVEAGVNIDLSGLPQPYFTPGYLLSQIICFQGRKPFLPMKSIRGAGQGIECSMTNYRIKGYDKGAQYHLPNPLIRFEYDCNQMKELQPMGIKLLSDLTDFAKMDSLGKKIQGILADMVIVEPLAMNGLLKAQRKLIEKAERPSFWSELSRRNRNYYLHCFRDLTQTYSLYRLHETLRNQVAHEWETLTQNCNIFAGVHTPDKIERETESCNIFTGLLTINGAGSETEDCNIFLPVNSEKRYNALDEVAGISFVESVAVVSGNVMPDQVGKVERYCEVTGIPLHQKQPPNSKVVGILTLTHDAEAFALLRQRYGHKKCKRDYHPEEYRLAHGPRNEKSNPRHNLLRRVRKSIANTNTELFPLDQVLRLTTTQLAIIGSFEGTPNELSLSNSYQTGDIENES